jgi:hypothetical protein
MPGTEPTFEGSGRHDGQSPDEEIGRARTSTIRRWPHDLGALCLRYFPGGGDNFNLRAGCARAMLTGFQTSLHRSKLNRAVFATHHHSKFATHHHSNPELISRR